MARLVRLQSESREASGRDCRQRSSIFYVRHILGEIFLVKRVVEKNLHREILFDVRDHMLRRKIVEV